MSLLPSKSKLDVPRYKWLTLCIVEIAEGTANLCMLGFFTVHWRGKLLFSDWMDPN